MKITMNMSNYEIESVIENEIAKTEYGDEILCAGWNPEVDTACLQLQLVPTTKQRAMPATLTTEVVDLFMKKMYASQR